MWSDKGAYAAAYLCYGKPVDWRSRALRAEQDVLRLEACVAGIASHHEELDSIIERLEAWRIVTKSAR
jgi:hypothetical protein